MHKFFISIVLILGVARSKINMHRLFLSLVQRIIYHHLKCHLKAVRYWTSKSGSNTLQCYLKRISLLSTICPLVKKILRKIIRIQKVNQSRKINRQKIPKVLQRLSNLTSQCLERNLLTLLSLSLNCSLSEILENSPLMIHQTIMTLKNKKKMNPRTQENLNPTQNFEVISYLLKQKV